MLLYEKAGNIGILTINRPEALNALNSALLDCLYEKVTEIAHDTELRCLIVTGAGKAFVAGADISEMKDIEKLVIMGTNLIMLELPYRSYEKWISEEIYNISAEYNLKVIIAHVHRYFEYYSSSEIERILSIKPVFQVNNEAFENRKEKRFIKNLINEEKEIVFGSDAHNLTSRKPNWDLLQKKVDVSIIETSDKMLERYANYMAV